MKRIMFKDRYGLTQAVLDGKKTMTRREIKLPNGITHSDMWNPVMGVDVKGKVYFTFDCICCEQRDIAPLYQVGEEVAIAQSYETLANSRYRDELGMMDTPTTLKKEFCGKGWGNKMFVKAEYMPYRIRITNIKVERLQDISEEDCMREGLLAGEQEPKMYGFRLPKGTVLSFTTPRDAFAALIDRISGRGTWNRNPVVFAYEFELVK